MLAENAVKPVQKRVYNSKLNLDFIIIHSIVITLVTLSEKAKHHNKKVSENVKNS